MPPLPALPLPEQPSPARCGWGFGDRVCEGLQRDDLATTRDECRVRCCLDATCVAYQFDEVQRKGSECCGAVCWRGRPTTCKGTPLNFTMASGRKLYMPDLDPTASANASVSDSPLVAPGDVVALSLSAGGLSLAAAICCWCARRKLSARAVFPRDHLRGPPPKAEDPLKVGDVVAGTSETMPDTPRAPAVAMEVPLPLVLSEAAEVEPPAKASPQTDADTGLGLDIDDFSSQAAAVPPKEENLAPAFVDLASVRLVDDAHGGVWAAVRDSPVEGGPLRSPFRRSSDAKLQFDPRHKSAEPEWLDDDVDNLASAGLVEQDLVLETFEQDLREET